MPQTRAITGSRRNAQLRFEPTDAFSKGMELSTRGNVTAKLRNCGLEGANVFRVLADVFGILANDALEDFDALDQPRLERIQLRVDLGAQARDGLDHHLHLGAYVLEHYTR